MPKRVLSFLESAYTDWSANLGIVSGGDEGTLSNANELFFGYTSKGEKVYEHNEDSIGYYTDFRKRITLVVADGIGGASGGSTASQTLVDTIVKNLAKVRSLAKILTYYVPASLEAVHSRLVAAGQHSRLTDSMGATYAVVDIRKSHARVYHQGDSKAIHIRNGEILGQTIDHTLAETLKANGLNPETMGERANHIVMNCISLVKGTYAIENQIARSRWELKQGDWIILGTDGLFDVLEPSEVLTVANSFDTPAEVVYALLKCVKNLVKKGAKDDNISILAYKHP